VVSDCFCLAMRPASGVLPGLLPPHSGPLALALALAALAGIVCAPAAGVGQARYGAPFLAACATEKRMKSWFARMIATATGLDHASGGPAAASLFP